MKNLITNINVHKKLILPAVIVGMLSGCASTTNTGTLGIERKQLLLVSEQAVMNQAAQSYQEILSQARSKNVLDKDKATLARLQRIAKKLIPHTAVYRSDATQWQWELHTIQSDKVNAFVMPGGKIVFYEGIVKKLNLTDSEIAAIMGHEMSHALREHTRERMSSSQMTQLGIGIATSSLKLSKGEQQLAGIAGNLGINLPHNRVQESEADIMGLELMARAGYNPQSSVTLWKKMRKNGGGSVPQFLSTHPNSDKRITVLSSLVPKVMPLYKEAIGK